MRRVELREARRRFSHLIRAVRAGEEMLLLDRGTPIAVVKPLTQLKTAMNRLQAQGIVSAARKPSTLPAFRPLRARVSLSRALLDERNERD